MDGWVVSMHGTWFPFILGDNPKWGASSQGAVSHVKIPPRRTIHFYVKENQPLHGGWDTFRKLMDREKIDEARQAAIESRTEGQMCRNYTLQPEPKWKDSKGMASGVYLAGDRDSSKAWILDKVDDWFTLAQLLDHTSAGDEIFWVACRLSDCSEWRETMLRANLPGVHRGRV